MMIKPFRKIKEIQCECGKIDISLSDSSSCLGNEHLSYMLWKLRHTKLQINSLERTKYFYL